MSPKSFAFCGLVAFVLPSSALAAPYVVRSGHVEFLARITGGSFVGKSDAVTGSFDYDEATHKLTKGVIDVKAATLETGMSMRDTHTREKYLEADKFPLIQLEVAEQVLTPNDKGEAKVDAFFVLKGQKRPLALTVRLGSGTEHSVEASFQIDITAFGIPQPKFAVVKMDPVVDVSTKLTVGPAR